MLFNNKKNIYSLPINKNIGCIGLLLGIFIISVVLFLGFFVGVFVFGLFLIFYIYKYIKNKFFKNNTLDNNINKFTDAEYIEISDDDENNKI